MAETAVAGTKLETLDDPDTYRQKPSALVDTCAHLGADNTKQLANSFFSAFDHFDEALSEIKSFFMRSHKASPPVSWVET